MLCVLSSRVALLLLCRVDSLHCSLTLPTHSDIQDLSPSRYCPSGKCASYNAKCELIDNKKKKKWSQYSIKGCLVADALDTWNYNKEILVQDVPKCIFMSHITGVFLLHLKDLNCTLSLKTCTSSSLLWPLGCCQRSMIVGCRGQGQKTLSPCILGSFRNEVAPVVWWVIVVRC